MVPMAFAIMGQYRKQKQTKKNTNKNVITNHKTCEGNYEMLQEKTVEWALRKAS